MKCFNVTSLFNRKNYRSWMVKAIQDRIHVLNKDQKTSYTGGSLL